MKNIVFWSVDNQIDFIEPTGKLAVLNATGIKENIHKLTLLAKEKNITTVHTSDWHKTNSKELSDMPDFINTFPPHCMENTDGAKLIKEATPESFDITISWEKDNNKLQIKEAIKLAKDIRQAKNILILKDEFDVFSGCKQSNKVVNLLSPHTVVVYGVATNVCVNFAVVGLAKRVPKTIVVIDAIKELPNIPIKDLVENWIKMGVIFTAINKDNLQNNAVFDILNENGVAIESLEKLIG